MRRCAPTDRVDAERKRAAEEIRGRRFGPFAAAGPVRLLLVAMLVGGAGLFFAVGGLDLLSFEALGRERQALAAWVDERAVAAPLAFVALYAALTALSLPLGTVLTVAAGFLFGPVAGTALAVAGATSGATVAFLAARTILGDRLRARVGGALRRMDAGFRENAFNYLLAMRLIPLFPFWLVNLAPAFAEVRPGTFVAATALGIVPGTFVFALVGNGLGALIAAGEEPDLSIVLRPEILMPIVGLAVLALLPVAYRKLVGPVSR